MLWELINRMAHATLTIGISGETGTGKQSIARLIGSHYPYENSVFSEFNCKMLKMQSKAPAGSSHTKAPLEEFLNILQAPRQRVIYLENIDHLTGDLQDRLLAMIHKNHCPAAPWIISSSLKPLEPSAFNHLLVKALGTIHIALPPLRDNPERIPQMFAWLVSRYNDTDRFTPNIATMERLIRYHWPGNWRQLQRVIRACIQTKELYYALDSSDLDRYKDEDHEEQIDELAAIYILSPAELNIQKECVLEGLISSSNLDEIGLLDLAIFQEAVCQIADYFSTSQPKKKPE